MKSKLELIKNQFNFRNKSRKSILLSVVALIEIIAIMVVSTYAWVETASTIIIGSDGFQQIDSYIYTNADLNGNNAGVIDLSRYYRASGNMHLSSATSSDGSKIFFPRVASTSGSVIGLRQGEISDKNTNYISFKFKVTAKDAETKLIFDRVPEIKIDGAAVNDNSIRVAVNDGSSSTKVFSKNSSSGNININGDDYATDIFSFGDYAGSTAIEKKHYVFTLLKNETKTITVTVWLQDPNKAKEANVTIGDLKLIPHTSSTREVRFTDYTTRFNTSLAGSDISWASNDGTQMWMRDVTRNELTKMDKSSVNGNQWAGYVENKSISQIKGDVEFYNCDSSVTSAQVMTNYNCKWTESFANLTDSELADTPDFKAYGRFADNSTKTGFGTWHNLSEIQLDSEYASALPKPNAISDTTKVTLKTQSGAGVAVEMAYDNSANYKVWRAYIPNDAATSQNLHFTFTRDSKNYTYNAIKRDVTSLISTYVVTSDNTGYWVPPATVRVALGNGCEGKGKVNVTGGIPGATEVKVTQGTQVTLNAEMLPDDDTYGFVAWYYNPECTRQVSAKPNYTITAPESETPVTYYAKFMLQHKITLYSLADDDTTESTRGGTVQIKGKTEPAAKAVAYVFDKGLAEIKATVKPSHNFLGWFNNAGDAKPVYDYSNSDVNISNVQKDIILYAKFAIKKFEIEAQSKYEILNPPSIGTGDNGGTVTINNDSQADSDAYIKVTVNYDGSAIFKAYAKDTDGYKFAGWYTDEDCTEENKESADNPYEVKKIQANKKLYAKFELKTYDVTAHAVSDGTNDDLTYGNVCQVVNGTAQAASNKVTAKGIKHGASVTFRANNTSNATFDGWYSDEACKTKFTTADTDVKLINNDITLTVKSARNIYAKFTPIKYKATAHAGSNGQVKVGSNSWSTTTSQTDVIKGNSVTFNAQANNGYEFEGWYTAATGGTLKSSDAEFTAENVSGNIDYYARFKTASKRTIYFYNNNNWDKVYAYCWQDSNASNKNKGWPGLEMTHLGGKVWSYEYSPSSNWDKVIFNGGSSDKQTSNLDLPTSNTNTYYKDNNWTLSSNISHTVTVSTVNYATVTVTYKTGDNVSHTISEGSSAKVYEGTELTFNATGITSGYTVTSYKVNNANVSGTTYTLDNADITVSATVTAIQSGKKIYFKPDSKWASSDAWFAIYDSSGKWYKMNPETGGYYSYTFTSNVTQVIFVRMKNTDKNTLDWSNKWNQQPSSGFITIPTDGKNCYVLNNCQDGQSWDNVGGSWTTK